MFRSLVPVALAAATAGLTATAARADCVVLLQNFQRTRNRLTTIRWDNGGVSSVAVLQTAAELINISFFAI